MKGITALLRRVIYELINIPYNVGNNAAIVGEGEFLCFDIRDLLSKYKVK